MMSFRGIKNLEQIEESFVNLYNRKLREIVCKHHELNLYHRMLEKKKLRES